MSSAPRCPTPTLESQEGAHGVSQSRGDVLQPRRRAVRSAAISREARRRVAGGPLGHDGRSSQRDRGGRAALTRDGRAIDDRIAAVGRDDLATIVYTSGTTGPPKGVMQTHGNHLAALEAVEEVGLAREGEVDFFFLPLAHSFARMVEY